MSWPGGRLGTTPPSSPVGRKWKKFLLRKDCSPRAGAESLLLWVEHKGGVGGAGGGEAERGGAKPQGL